MDMVQLLEDDKNLIIYRKNINKITHKVTATILLQQLIYWHTKMKGPFYKFIEPCNHELYKKGDSWIEELGFSKKEFGTAFHILRNLGIVSKRTNINRVTYYELNIDILCKLLKRVYASSENDSTCVPKKSLDITDTTSKITTKSTKDMDVPYQEIVDHLNTILGSTFKWTSQHTQSLINERWSEGFRVEDFMQVHIIKFAEWSNDPIMSKYLRPLTLYSNKFEGYRNQRLNDSEMANAIQHKIGMSANDKLKMRLGLGGKQ